MSCLWKIHNLKNTKREIHYVLHVLYLGGKNFNNNKIHSVFSVLYILENTQFQKYRKRNTRCPPCPVSGRREGGAINSMDVITAPSLLRYNASLCYNTSLCYKYNTLMVLCNYATHCCATILHFLQYLTMLQCFPVLQYFAGMQYVGCEGCDETNRNKK